MTANKFDVIIPTAGKEASFVHRVTEYVRANFLEADKIYIITNKRYIKKIEKTIGKQNDVIVLDEDSILDGLTIDRVRTLLKKYTECTAAGWYFQQFLKYAFSLSDFVSKDYLSWDADTIPVSKLSFYESNRPVFTKKYEYNANYFATIKKLLGLDKKVPYSFIAEHMLFSPDIVKKLLVKIEDSDVPGEIWYEKIIRAGDHKHPLPAFSEFETYGTFVMEYYPNSYSTRQLNTFRRGGWIMGRSISDKKLKSLSFDLDTISFEMRDEPAFPYNLPNIWWRMKDLVGKGFRYSPKIVIKKAVKLFFKK